MTELPVLVAVGSPKTKHRLVERWPSELFFSLVATDGGVFVYGASFFGSQAGTHLNAPIVGIANL